MNRKLVMNEVVLVNSKDEELGTMEKLAAHKSGHLHRAFSIFIFNDAGEMLIQKRASSKYHSANLWTNACCSHPAPNEKIEDAAKRRLKEELDLDTPVDWVFSFEYKTEFENGLIENELDYVLVGYSNEIGKINPEEVSDLKFIPIDELFIDINEHPENYSFWLKIIISKYWAKISTNLEKK